MNERTKIHDYSYCYSLLYSNAYFFKTFQLSTPLSNVALWFLKKLIIRSSIHLILNCDEKQVKKATRQWTCMLINLVTGSLTSNFIGFNYKRVQPVRIQWRGCMGVHFCVFENNLWKWVMHSLKIFILLWIKFWYDHREKMDFTVLKDFTSQLTRWFRFCAELSFT